MEAIKIAEQNTSGEIRVHIESECKTEVLIRAEKVFNKLKMHKTELQNGVLFYIASDSKHFAIIGDTGINQVVPNNFWESTKNLVLDYFSKGEMAKGISKGIIMAGEQLKKHFPSQENDINELSDEISIGK